MNRAIPFIIFIFAIAFFFVSERMRPAKKPLERKIQSIEVWCTSIPAETILEFTAKFEELNPQYKVRVQTVAWNSLQEKTLWAVAAGSNVPDLILGSSEWTGGLANSGALDPFDNHLPPEFFAQFFPSALGTYQFPFIDRDKPGEMGAVHQYGIPLDLDLMMIYYRADLVDPLLKELDMTEFPQDWDGFQRLGAKAYTPRTVSGVSQNLIYMDPEDPVPMRMAFLPASGGTMFTRDLKQANFDTPEAIAAFDFMATMFKTHGAKEWNPTTQGDPMELIKSERVIANISGPWYAKMLETKAPEQFGKWRVAMFPKRKPQYLSTGLGGSCLAMPYNAENKKGAVALAKFLSSQEFAMSYFRKVNSPPPLIAAWSDRAFDEPQSYFGGQKVFQVVRESIEDSRSLQLLPNAQVMKQHVRWAMYEIAVRGANTTETLQIAVERANKALSQKM